MNLAVSQTATAERAQTSSRAPRWTSFFRIRWQIASGLLIAVFLPAVFVWPSETMRLSATTLNNTMIATAAALICGYMATRRLAVFPGIQVMAFILPAFASTYGITAVALLLTRFGYSRLHFLVSFIVAVAFYHVSFWIERRVRRPHYVYVPKGKTSDLLETGRVDWTPWRSPDELPRGFNGVVADLRTDLDEAWEGFLARCALAGIPVFHTKQVQESLTGRVNIEALSENSLGSLEPSSVYAKLKRIGDILLALLLLPILLPIGIVLAIAIKLDSPGPVFFRQQRMGFRGQEFTIWKLRTMRDDVQGTDYTEGTDPRITRLGKTLRKYRIDELPQIINILKGDMSWIGPRPESLSLSEWYDSEIAFYCYRHIVRPGISGWAQVQQGYAAKPDAVKFKLHYDFYYIKYFSAWLDLVIAAQTVRTILTGFGAR